MSAPVRTVRDKPDDDREPFFTPKTLAAYLAVSERTICQMVADRRIESVRVGGARRFPVSAVDAYVAAHTDKARS